MKEAQVLGKQVRKRVRKLPKTPLPSLFTKAPKNLPIDFYDPEWFNDLTAGQKRLVADATRVAFLPNASDSMKPVQHPDEKLGDMAFDGKYLDILSEPYELTSDEEGGPDEEDGDEEEEEEDSISVDGEKSESESEDSEFYSEGECGDLYDGAAAVEGEEGEGGDEMDAE